MLERTSTLERNGAYETKRRPAGLKYHVGQVVSHETWGDCAVYGWEEKPSCAPLCLCSVDLSPPVKEEPLLMTSEGSADAGGFASAGGRRRPASSSRAAASSERATTTTFEINGNEDEIDEPYYRVLRSTGMISFVPQHELAPRLPDAATAPDAPAEDTRGGSSPDGPRSADASQNELPPPCSLGDPMRSASFFFNSIAMQCNARGETVSAFYVPNAALADR